MRVCLLDVDSKIPNLALMRASTWHKQRGDDVKLGYDPLFDRPDLCYASKIFDYTPVRGCHFQTTTASCPTIRSIRNSIMR